MKEFTKADLKPGMAVELRNGKYCLVVPNQSGLLIAHVEGEALCGLVRTESLSDDMKYLDRVCKMYDVMKVYGLTTNGGLLLCQNKDKRDLLWERREPKRMTLAEIEEVLGFPVEIVRGDL